MSVNMIITNFGNNVSFAPKHLYTPKSEEEVLEILNKHKDGQIRVLSSGHAWSEAIVSKDALINLKNLNNVSVKTDKNGQVWVTAQGGCILKKLVETVHANSNATMPTLGGLMKQTIAGAISTATHGSGKQSLSHFIFCIRIAAYDKKTGKAKIFEFDSGDELRVARCAVGCMGIILSVTFKAQKKYWIKEVIVKKQKLQDIISKEKDYPLTQFMLIPYAWIYIAHQRKVVYNEPDIITKVRMRILRLEDFLSTEIGAHVLLKMLLAIFSSKGQPSFIISLFYKKIVPRLLHEAEAVNPATVGLTLHTLHHAMFQHVEMELFIPEENLEKAVDLLQQITQKFASSSYMHHYPLFFRKVLPDDALISMTSGGKIYYSVSVFTYLPEDKREKFYQFTKILAQTLVKECNARLHWGKYFPLKFKDVKHLYPNIKKFQRICSKFDPNGIFCNEFTKNVLGF